MALQLARQHVSVSSPSLSAPDGLGMLRLSHRKWRSSRSAPFTVNSRLLSGRGGGPALLSKIYLPITRAPQRKQDDSLRSAQLLQQAGFIRQSSAGIFSFLPFGQRVIEKLEDIVEEEMIAIGAGKIALPNLLPPTLWQKTGRWQSTGAELWRLQDRRRAQMLLAPTHEEEITALVNNDIVSEKALPARLFQIGRKFRDEARPRGGLLRCREFLMKDLYTFDASKELARATYEEVKAAYCRIFDRIGVPYSVAQADTGNIGGTASHEFHYVSSAGEDTLISCPQCKYTANAELAIAAAPSAAEALEAEDCSATFAESPAHNQLAVVITPLHAQLNHAKLAKVADGAKPIASGKALDEWDGIQILLDRQCAGLDPDSVMELVTAALHGVSPSTIWSTPPACAVHDLVFAKAGDGCSVCKTGLETHTSIEIGHTFLLGDKYSAALGATFARTKQDEQMQSPFEMGCYGIGITRILGAIAEVWSDDNGLVWPPSIAPYETCVMPVKLSHKAAAVALASSRGHNTVIDDRTHLSFGSRMRDAELVGYPEIIVIGQRWDVEQKVEVHTRRNGAKKIVLKAELGRDPSPKL